MVNRLIKKEQWEVQRLTAGLGAALRCLVHLRLVVVFWIAMQGLWGLLLYRVIDQWLTPLLYRAPFDVPVADAWQVFLLELHFRLWKGGLGYELLSSLLPLFIIGLLLSAFLRFVAVTAIAEAVLDPHSDRAGGSGRGSGIGRHSGSGNGSGRGRHGGGYGNGRVGVDGQSARGYAGTGNGNGYAQRWLKFAGALKSHFLFFLCLQVTIVFLAVIPVWLLHPYWQKTILASHSLVSMLVTSLPWILGFIAYMGMIRLLVHYFAFSRVNGTGVIVASQRLINQIIPAITLSSLLWVMALGGYALLIYLTMLWEGYLIFVLHQSLLVMKALFLLIEMIVLYRLYQSASE